ncbi:MAG: SH3 domain-containing protein [Acidobacteriota bacterium]|nr:MAG: SH3 domain-containing protein [Acidobacteriota bacterium]
MSFVFALVMQLAVESPQEAFARAEALYQEQRYDEAAGVYESMRDAGIEDAALYYNLGNAYFKAGRLGLSVLSYERALVLVPGDEDVRMNLSYANELVADAVDEAPLPLAIRWVVDLYRGLRPGLLAVFLSAAFLLGGVALTLLLLDAWDAWDAWRQPPWRSFTVFVLGVCAVLALASGGALAAKVRAQSNRVDAIVLTENAYVRSGPGVANPRLAEIHEGLKVRVISEREGWYQVTLANGLTGWLRESEIEAI